MLILFLRGIANGMRDQTDSDPFERQIKYTLALYILPSVTFQDLINMFNSNMEYYNSLLTYTQSVP